MANNKSNNGRVKNVERKQRKPTNKNKKTSGVQICGENADEGIQFHIPSFTKQEIITFFMIALLCLTFFTLGQGYAYKYANERANKIIYEYEKTRLKQLVPNEINSKYKFNFTRVEE